MQRKYYLMLNFENEGFVLNAKFRIILDLDRKLKYVSYNIWKDVIDIKFFLTEHKFCTFSYMDIHSGITWT